MELNWTALIAPKGLEAETETGDATYGKYVVAPLERGYGVTLGNALRRILLSSLRGGAITKLRMPGVLHEMTSVAGVVEDITDIILNLKEVRLALPDDSVTRLRLAVQNPTKAERVVRAGDFSVPAGVRVLNADRALLTLAPGGSVDAEFEARLGKGYVPASGNKDPNMSVDWIAIDSIFTPIRKVNFVVSDARVGQQTDFDKLTIEILTDGSLSPRDALARAAKIMKTQLQVFINFEEETEGRAPSVGRIPTDMEEFNENLFKTIEELDLSVRSANCLQNAGVRYVWELVERNEAELLKAKNFGRKSLMEILAALEGLGLKLGMRLPKNFPRQVRPN